MTADKTRNEIRARQAVSDRELVLANALARHGASSRTPEQEADIIVRQIFKAIAKQKKTA